MNASKTLSSTSRLGVSMYESEAQRLQREADNFTKKFEHEKKRLMILEDQLKQANEELNEKKENIKQIRPPTAKMQKDGYQIKLFENQLEKSLVKYNDLQATNRKLRQEIDVMRKEQRNQIRVNKTLVKDISLTADDAKKLNVTTYQGQRISEETNNQILALKAKHEAEKYNFERKIKDLQDKLKEKDDSELERTRTKEMSGTKKLVTQQTEFSNPAALLKLRLQKWTTNNKEKKNLMDMYIRNVKIIEDAFDQIKEATGISSTEEIVTTFIKAEEQNYSLYNYVNMLNSEIDMIEEQNKNIESEIRRHEELGEMTEKEKLNMRKNLNNEIDDIRQQTNIKESQIQDIEGQMGTIRDYVKQMVDMFKQSQFFLSVAQNMQYDEETQFNENNVTLYLAELEEYISLLITFMAYKQENPDAAISSLSLERMINKEFDKGPINIEAPSSNDVNLIDDAETEDDVITNGKDLYKKFEDLVHKDHISIGSHNNSISKGGISMLKNSRID
eukprot:403338159